MNISNASRVKRNTLCFYSGLFCFCFKYLKRYSTLVFFSYKNTKCTGIRIKYTVLSHGFLVWPTNRLPFLLSSPLSITFSFCLMIWRSNLVQSALWSCSANDSCVFIHYGHLEIDTSPMWAMTYNISTFDISLTDTTLVCMIQA